MTYVPTQLVNNCSGVRTVTNNRALSIGSINIKYSFIYSTNCRGLLVLMNGIVFKCTTKNVHCTTYYIIIDTVSLLPIVYLFRKIIFYVKT